MFPIDYFLRSAAYRPDAIAVRDGDVSLTYAELRRKASALAKAFQEVAGQKRVRVALLCPNSIDLLISIIAIHASGGILIPLNPRNGRPELGAQIELVRPQILVADNSCLDLVDITGMGLIVAGVDACVGHPTVRGLIEEFSDQSPSWPAVSLDDDYAVKFTGGSSGRPKGVRQSFRSHGAVILHVLLGLDFKEGEVYVCAAPMTHGAGSFVLPTLAVNGTIVIAHGSKPETLLDTIEAAAGSATWVPPTLLYMLIEEQRLRPRPLKALRHLIFGGGPAAPEKIDEGRRVFGPVLETTFGQTEASTIASALPARDMADESIRYSAGRAGPLVKIAIMDAEGRRLEPGEVGEIAVAGDLLMSGYLELPKETAQVLVDGWLRTGDVGYLDARGFLFVKDRIRDVVITGGFNVYPSDVEAALAKHPAVHECVVYGVADPHWGERVEAAVELRPGAGVTGQELIEFAKDHVGAVKAPKFVHVVESLPRSPVGKVLRREAKALFGGRQASTPRQENAA